MQAIRDIFARLALIDSADSPRWRIAVTILGLLLCVLGLGGVVQMWLAHPAYPDAGTVDLLNNTDFDLYIRAADNLSNNPYREDIGTWLDRYGYPPLLADALAGLKAVLGPQLIGILWPVLCTLCLIGAVAMLSRQFGVKLARHWVVLIVGVIVLGRIVRVDIYHGQVNVIILALLVGGLLLRSQGRIVAASVAFAVMMSLKPILGAVVIYFLLRGDWRMARWSLLMGAAVFFASFIPTWPNILDAANGWRDATQHFTSPPFVTKPDNQSMYGLLLRLFTETRYTHPWINAPLLVPAFMTIAVTLAGVLAILGLHVGRGAEPHRIGPPAAVLLLECAFVLSLVMFCGPLTEGNHLILCLAGLFGAAIVGYERIAGGSRNSGLWLATIIAWALPCFFVVFPKSLWFTLGDHTAWSGLEGWELLLSGRCAFLLLAAGSLTAVSMWRERVLMAELPEFAPRPFGKRRAMVQPQAQPSLGRATYAVPAE